MDFVGFRAGRRGFGFWSTLFRNPFIAVLVGFGIGWVVHDWVGRNLALLERLAQGAPDVARDDQVVYGGMHAPASRSARSPFDDVRGTARRIADQVGMSVDDATSAAEQAWRNARDRADELSKEGQDDIGRGWRARRFMEDLNEPSS
jgi:hypothetical protein